MLRTVSRRSALASFILLGLASLSPAVAHGGEKGRTYLALGDSIAWGVTNVVPVSYGDQGYVKLYADWLATRDDGVRPKVINLAISGESSESFFTGPGALPPGYPRDILSNLNYTSPTQTQFTKFLEVVSAEKAAGRRIEVVSFCLGANDLFSLLASPQWNAAGADHQALLDQTLNEIHANYFKFLTSLRVELPHARLLLLNYYNPFEVLGPDDPFNQLFIYFDGVHSAFVQELAKQFKGHFVDIYTPFLGHARQYTYILQGNVHPNKKGYCIIAQQMISEEDDEEEDD
jgi:lysophospholipase L1-like esterase